MLIQFSVANYKSFRDETLLNMIPAKSRDMKDHIIGGKDGKGVSALPVAAVYGANASGKSNLIKALEFAKSIVVEGTPPNKNTWTQPFLLSGETKTSPSRFEFVFKHEETLYTYGFIVSSKEIVEEWLFAKRFGPEFRLFERKTENGKTVIETGPQIEKGTGRNALKILAGFTPVNQLFLTDGANRGVEALRPARYWFERRLWILKPNPFFDALPFLSHKQEKFAKFLDDLLRMLDTGVDKISLKKELFNEDAHFSEIPLEEREKFLKEIYGMDIDDKRGTLIIQTSSGLFNVFKDKAGVWCVNIKAGHASDDGVFVDFDLKDESDGTRKLMHLSPALQAMLLGEGVYVLDELDRSLHPLLSKTIIKIFLEAVTSGKSKSQLIFTTHDTNLLDRDLLRRDEIWFAEKDTQGASHLTSLAEYRVTSGLNYENGYLNGRFGAIPYLGDWRGLLRK
jgi:AAA15 family ATPase/GTPase